MGDIIDARPILIVPNGGQWLLKREGAPKAGVPYGTVDAAVSAARLMKPKSIIIRTAKGVDKNIYCY